MAEEALFIWERLRTERATRKLNYGAIVRAAMKLADRDGLEAVSMRNVARALNAGTMSLYRYVSGKEDLLDLILDAAYGEITLPESPQLNWQERLRRVSDRVAAGTEGASVAGAADLAAPDAWPELPPVV